MNGKNKQNFMMFGLANRNDLKTALSQLFLEILTFCGLQSDRGAKNSDDTTRSSKRNRPTSQIQLKSKRDLKFSAPRSPSRSKD